MVLRSIVSWFDLSVSSNVCDRLGRERHIILDIYVRILLQNGVLIRETVNSMRELFCLNKYALTERKGISVGCDLPVKIFLFNKNLI